MTRGITGVTSVKAMMRCDAQRQKPANPIIRDRLPILSTIKPNTGHNIADKMSGIDCRTPARIGSFGKYLVCKSYNDKS
jgi:hypothetical protein